MRTSLGRFLAIIFVFLSAIALIITVIGIFRVWEVKASISESLLVNLELIDSALEATANGLVIVDETIDNVSGNVGSLETAISQLSRSIHDTGPMLITLEDMAAIEIPATITATQTSLASASSSALFIDNMMAALANVPLLGLGRYQPETPLSVSLAEVSTNLEAVKPSLGTISTSLSTAHDNLVEIEAQVNQIGTDIQTISQNLDDAKLVVADYQTTIGRLQGQISDARRALPSTMDGAAWGITFILAWMIVTQAAVIIWGLGAFRIAN